MAFYYFSFLMAYKLDVDISLDKIICKLSRIYMYIETVYINTHFPESFRLLVFVLNL